MKHLAALALVVAASAAGGCVRVPYQHADAMSAVPIEPLGEARLSLRWRFITADRLTEMGPQEFASAAVSADRVYIGSDSGMFFALRALTGAVIWKKQIGPVGSAPLISAGMLYIGTSDGELIALDMQTGIEKWRYAGRGVIAQTAIATGDLIVFANEADQVVALDAATGRFKWQYKTETPDEFTLRGHAGVASDGELLYTGFSNGTLVALRRDTGSVAWSTSLTGEATKFVDVDATPLVLGDRVYVSSSSGGVFAVDKLTGLVRWRVPFWDAAMPSETGNVGGLVTDGKTLYVSVADLGTYAIDLNGNIIWRVGAKDGGEPAAPVIYGDLLIYTLAEDGMFLANRKTGETLEYFDPGSGISAQPTVTSDGRLYVLSNRGIFYAFDLD
jgi:outer membrane protein assembly factor BamB